MPHSFRIALTADLHWGQNQRGDEATRALQAYLETQPPDLLLLGGDQGSTHHFSECLELFAGLSCAKGLVPGNHDIWVEAGDGRGDSLAVYREHLPRVCAEHGFHYLDDGPLFFEAAGLAVAGSINWYDYSWSVARMRREIPDWEVRLRTKTFSRGRHNDARFVRWPLDDETFTHAVVSRLREQIAAALTRAEQVVVLTHHPAFYGLSFPRTAPPTGLDGLLWDALSGNTALEKVLAENAERIPLVFSGHTHREREGALGNIRGYNIGGDYHYKRLLVLDWPEGNVTAHLFQAPS